METFEYKGIWWLADRPEEKASGTLKYTPAEGAILDLMGSFKDIKDFNNMLKPEIILGVSSNGKRITLYKCFEKSSARSYRGLLTSSFYANGDGLVVKTKCSLLLRCISFNMLHPLVADNKPRRVCRILPGSDVTSLLETVS